MLLGHGVKGEIALSSPDPPRCEFSVVWPGKLQPLAFLWRLVWHRVIHLANSAVCAVDPGTSESAGQAPACGHSAGNAIREQTSLA